MLHSIKLPLKKISVYQEFRKGSLAVQTWSLLCGGSEMVAGDFSLSSSVVLGPLHAGQFGLSQSMPFQGCWTPDMVADFPREHFLRKQRGNV